MSDKAYRTITAALTAPAAGIVRVLAPVTGTFERAYFFSDNALSGGNAIFDVNVNGTSIWDADQTQRPKVLDGDTVGDKTGIAQSVSELTDIIEVDFDGFTGSAASVGGKLIVILFFSEPGSGVGTLTGAKLHLTADQSIPQDVDTPAWAINWDAAVRDDGGFFSASDGQIKIPSGGDGWYQIAAQVAWAGEATGNRKIEIVVDTASFSDGIVLARVYALGLGTTHRHYQQASAIHYLEAGWNVYVRAWQNSSGALDVIANDDDGAPDLVHDETWLAITPAGRP